ncbi:MAG: AlpA family phage regulatory protein [Alphaproteobacteria bacterium]|nr:AlpA family phage regulatory protein [Alphaproteobacteria bacterium]MBU2380811.1 AlpA family phage regulatory protein [Alphaproteobacteria bacterium]
MGRLLPWARVQEIAGISRTTAWRLQKTGEFPEPVQISAQRVGWWESELTAWKARKAAGTRGGASLPPPRSPRLIETVRSYRDPPAAPVVFREAPVADAVSAAETQPRKRKRAVSPDQIDFGF